MFLIEKIISMTLISPLLIIILLLIIGVGNIFNRRKKSGLVLIIISVILYCASTDWIIDKKIYKLESSYPVVSEEELSKGEAYILLGGGIITTTVEGNIPGVLATTRILKTAEYYRKYPKKIYISGGTPLQNQESESSVYARELKELGVKEEDIIIEESSKNTNENALLIKEKLEQDGVKNVILITSATHIKRSMFIFQKKLDGVNIYPAPCNFLASQEKENNFYYIPKYYNFLKFQLWLWETVGNTYYKIRY
ncbi:YdcF family protein [Fusobacterium sp.]|uniref:YdcF family protein n=1 Tax=Fusobacterium sp. TaxID=68766 RepID=UPI0025BF4497|nr:YdcF family protein [Fusobacterium sp.]